MSALLCYSKAMQCVCTSTHLFCFGCRCGYIHKAELRLFFNGKDFVVARTNYHASYILEQDNVEPSAEPWKEIPGDEYVTFYIGSPDGEALMASEWVKVLGEGYAVAID